VSALDNNLLAVEHTLVAAPAQLLSTERSRNLFGAFMTVLICFRSAISVLGHHHYLDTSCCSHIP
jgi:hypothetical protein